MNTINDKLVEQWFDAVTNNDTDSLSLFIGKWDSGEFSPYVTNSAHETALHVCVRLCGVDILSYLCDNFFHDVNITCTNFGDGVCREVISPLNLSLLLGKYDHFMVLVSRGADINIIDNGKSSLHYACRGGNYECIEYVANSGTDVNLICGKYKTPLYNVVQHHIDVQNDTLTSDIIDLLVSRGADVNKSSMTVSSILNQAILRNSVPTILLLIEKGADLNKISPDAIGLLRGYCKDDINVILECIMIYSPCDIKFFVDNILCCDIPEFLLERYKDTIRLSDYGLYNI